MPIRYNVHPSVMFTAEQSEVLFQCWNSIYHELKSEVYTANMGGFIQGGRERYLNARPSGRDCGTVHVNPIHPTCRRSNQKHAAGGCHWGSNPQHDGTKASFLSVFVLIWHKPPLIVALFIQKQTSPWEIFLSFLLHLYIYIAFSCDYCIESGHFEKLWACIR